MDILNLLILDYQQNMKILNTLKQEVIMNQEQIEFIYGIHLNFYIHNVQKKN